MKKLFIALGVCVTVSIGHADTFEMCSFGPVTFGSFDMGSWENAEGTIVVEEPVIGTGNWISDLPSLEEELSTLQKSCDDTAERLIRAVSGTFPGAREQAEIFYDDRVQQCKDHFEEIYETYTRLIHDLYGDFCAPSFHR